MKIRRVRSILNIDSPLPRYEWWYMMISSDLDCFYWSYSLQISFEPLYSWALVNFPRDFHRPYPLISVLCIINSHPRYLQGYKALGFLYSSNWTSLHSTAMDDFSLILLHWIRVYFLDFSGVTILKNQGTLLMKSAAYGYQLGGI